MFTITTLIDEIGKYILSSMIISQLFGCKLLWPYSLLCYRWLTLILISFRHIFVSKFATMFAHDKKIWYSLFNACICLYDDYSTHGNGFLASFSNRVLCVAWIGTDLTCSCITRHLLTTTLRVIGARNYHGGFVYSSTQILHSTWCNVSWEYFLSLKFYFQAAWYLTSEVNDANDVIDSSSQVSCCRHI